MLAYILAIAVGLSSLALYLAAFFSPKIHRQDDFLWSGVGLFYALVLWVCAGRITGGVLLGQAAAVSLLLVFGWETLKLRRAIAYPQAKTDLEGFSLTKWVKLKLFKRSPKQGPQTKTEAAIAESAPGAIAPTETVAEAATEAVSETIAEPEAEVVGEQVQEAPQEVQREEEVIASSEEALETQTITASEEAEKETEAEVEIITEEIVQPLGEEEKEPEALSVSVTETLAEIEIPEETEITSEKEVVSPQAEVPAKTEKRSFFGKLLAPVTGLFRQSKTASPTPVTEKPTVAVTETEADIFADEFAEESLESEVKSTETDQLVDVSETPQVEATEAEETMVEIEESVSVTITSPESETETIISEALEAEVEAVTEEQIETAAESPTAIMEATEQETPEMPSSQEQAKLEEVEEVFASELQQLETTAQPLTEQEIESATEVEVAVELSPEKLEPELDLSEAETKPAEVEEKPKNDS